MSKQDARQKILEAAQQIAREAGPGNLSLDAVAARAGISKGGLLYHFPSKAKLLEAVVELFVTSFQATLLERSDGARDSRDKLLAAYIDLSVEDHICNKPPPSGLLAALAEDSSFMLPVQRSERMLLDRIKAESRDPSLAMVIFLALAGLRSTHLLDVDILEGNEFDEVVERLRTLADGQASA